MFGRLMKTIAMGAALALSTQVAFAGSPATEFTLRDTKGKSVSLDAYRGQVIVLSFWATWCGPCKKEMPYLQKMYDAYKEKGFVVLSVSSDDARARSMVMKYIRDHSYTFPVVLDPESRVTGIYNPSKTLPLTVVIDRNFEVHDIHTGFNPGDEKELDHMVQELLAKSAE